MLSEKYKIETVVKEQTVIYIERPLKSARHTIHIELQHNPYLPSIGLSVTKLTLGSGVQNESRVSLAYLTQSIQIKSYSPLRSSHTSLAPNRNGYHP